LNESGDFTGFDLKKWWNVNIGAEFKYMKTMLHLSIKTRELEVLNMGN
jgi:hypothetical protein